MIKVSELEHKVLVALVEVYDSHGGEDYCTRFKYIADDLKLEVRQVRRACRALARKGLAKYVRGLFDDDGMVAGSGYCATDIGAKQINSETLPIPLEN